MKDFNPTKFERNPDNHVEQRRRMIIYNGHFQKIIDFRIDDVFMAIITDKNILYQKSDEKIKEENKNFDEKYVQYKWEDTNEFYRVDCKKRQLTC